MYEFVYFKQSKRSFIAHAMLLIQPLLRKALSAPSACFKRTTDSPATIVTSPDSHALSTKSACSMLYSAMRRLATFIAFSAKDFSVRGCCAIIRAFLMRSSFPEGMARRRGFSSSASLGTGILARLCTCATYFG